MTDTANEREYMTPAEVARAFAVDPKTVTRWANQGLITPHHRTLGGIRRCARAEVEVLLRKDPR